MGPPCRKAFIEKGGILMDRRGLDFWDQFNLWSPDDMKGTGMSSIDMKMAERRTRISSDKRSIETVSVPEGGSGNA